MDASLPAGVVTFLASRADWPPEPADGGHILPLATADHRRIVTSAVEDRGGFPLHLGRDGHDGSSLLSVFVRASDAIHAARAIREAAMSHSWPTPEPPELRNALHTAEATPAGATYRGHGIELVSELCDRAGPGELILSGTTASIVAAVAGDDLILRPIDVATGPRRSIGERVFRLDDASGRRREPLTSSDADDLLGERGVTARERDVFDAVADRLTNAEIADRFSVSERTVESHVSALLRKLGAANRLELAALAASGAAAKAAHDLPPMLSMAARRARLVGRERERSDLVAAWNLAELGEASVMVVTGEAGIGKTQLVADVAATVHARDGLVLLGSSTDGARAPYQAVVEALEVPVGRSSEHRLRDDLGGAATDVARIVPMVRERLGLAPGQSTMEDRHAGAVGVANYLARLAGQHPVLLVLEDLHWASPPTRDIVLEIGRRAGSARLMVVATCRDVAPDLDAALASWLAAVGRLPNATVVRLDGLDLTASRMLLADLGRDVDPRKAHHRTGGNPLLLRECASGGSGSTMQDLVADRRARLSDDDLLVVDTAAVVGEVFGIDVVAAATALDLDAVVGGLERAAEAGLTQPLTPSANRHAFVHALVRDACYEALGAGRRLQIHASVAAALDGRADDDAVLPHLARHAAIAAPLGGADHAIGLSERVGQRALVAGDLPEAAAHFERALDILDLADHGAARRLHLTIRLGESLVLDDRVRSLQILRDATRLARRTGDAESFADAVCAMTTWGGSLSPGRRDETFVSLAEEALGMLPDSSVKWRCRVQSLLGSHLALSDEPDRGRRLARCAVELADRDDDPEGFVRAVLAYRYTLGAFDLDERRTALLAAERVAADAGLTALGEIAASALGMQAQWEGDLAAADRWYRRCRELTEANTVGTHMIHIGAALLAGDLDEALRRKEDAAVVLPPELSYLYVGVVDLVVGMMRAQPPPTALLEPLAGLDSFVGSSTRANLAYGHILTADLERARAALEEEASRGWLGLTKELTASGTLALWAEVAVAVGDRAEANALQSLLDRVPGTLGAFGAVPCLSIDRVRGLTRLVNADTADAVSVLEDAVTRSRERGTVVLLARELVALAEARVELGAATAEVDELVSEARQIGSRCGAAIVEHDIGLRLPDLR